MVPLLAALILLPAVSFTNARGQTPGENDSTGVHAVDQRAGGMLETESKAPGETATDTNEDIQQRRPAVKNPTGAALRSLVIPGWGQLYTGHWFKALVYFGTDAGMIYGILRQDARYMDYLAQSKEQKTDRLRSEYERVAAFYRDDRNRLIWWTAGWTLLATFDAFVEAHLYGFHIDPTLGITPQGDGPQVRITINGK